MNLNRNVCKLVLNYLKTPVRSSLQCKSEHNLQNVDSNFVVLKRLHSNYCWKCGTERKHSQIFCEKCKVVQGPLEKDNFFKVFDIEEKFDIDQRQLRNKFRKLQSLLHPDKFSNKTDEEQNISAEYSSLLNKAYSNLNAPLRRAEHLLNLKGEEIAEGQAADDPAFLMEVMELNEEVENASSDKDKLKQLNVKNKVKLQEISEEIDENFERNDVQAAKLSTIKLKYFDSLGNRLNAILRELGETD